MAHVASNASSTGTIFVEVATADVCLGAQRLLLSGREREYVVALALQSRPITRDALAALVNPDLEPAEAANSAKVYIFRLRKRVSQDFIVSTAAGYALGPRTRVDATIAHDVIEGRLGPCKLALDERERLFAMSSNLRAESPSFTRAWEWFDAYRDRLRRLGRDLALSIARDALSRGEREQAERFARELTYDDGCDEEAWELFIRALLLRGERSAALQSLRSYEAILAKELQAIPSIHLRQLLK